MEDSKRNLGDLQFSIRGTRVKSFEAFGGVLRVGQD